MLESKYQRELIARIKQRFPGCIVLKNDPHKMQGVSDLLVLLSGMWAGLEVKTSRRSPMRPNQEYYVAKMNEMSFAAVIYPENEEEVLSALQQAFEACR